MSLLHYEMHDIQQIPALLYGHTQKILGNLNMEQHEILLNEPLRNISIYIKNIYQKIPAHVRKYEKSNVKESIENLFNGKKAKTYSDYQKSLLVVCSFLWRNLLEAILQNYMKY